MRKVAQFLLVASRGLAICAVVAGLGVGLLDVYLSHLVCFDSCPDRDFYFSYLGPTAVRVMTPCIVLEVLAMAAFVTYCLATRQVQRAVLAFLVLLVGGLAGIAALAGLLQRAQATLPRVHRAATVAPFSRTNCERGMACGDGPSRSSQAPGRASWTTCNGAAERRRFHPSPPAF
jgi:hypothetical protein